MLFLTRRVLTLKNSAAVSQPRLAICCVAKSASLNMNARTAAKVFISTTQSPALKKKS